MTYTCMHQHPMCYIFPIIPLRTCGVRVLGQPTLIPGQPLACEMDKCLPNPHFPFFTFPHIYHPPPPTPLHTHTYTMHTCSASEESRELLLKGLKESTSKVRNNIFFLIGAAGSGKTSVMAVMMGEEPPETRDSTGCVTCPVRGMTTTRISNSGRVWTCVPYSEWFRQLATAFKVVAVRRAESTLCVPIESDDTTSPESPSSGDPSQSQAEQASALSEATPTFPPTKKRRVQSIHNGSDIMEELGSMLEAGQVDSLVELLEVDWINITDSGGQPAFHELAPFFMHNPSAALFTFKLSEELSSHYMVTYYKGGKTVGKPYRCSLNNEQILSSCMSSIPSLHVQEGTGVEERREEDKMKGAGGNERAGTLEREEKKEGGRKVVEKGTKIAFIGTHRDLEADCDETREQKEKKLAEMIPPSLRPHVLRCGENMDSSFLM